MRLSFSSRHSTTLRPKSKTIIENVAINNKPQIITGFIVYLPDSILRNALSNMDYLFLPVYDKNKTRHLLDGHADTDTFLLSSGPLLAV